MAVLGEVVVVLVVVVVEVLVDHVGGRGGFPWRLGRLGRITRPWRTRILVGVVGGLPPGA